MSSVKRKDVVRARANVIKRGEVECAAAHVERLTKKLESQRKRHRLACGGMPAGGVEFHFLGAAKFFVFE